MNEIELNVEMNPELRKIYEKIYRDSNPAVKDVQSRLGVYDPKLYGEKRTYSQNWSTYSKACSQEKLMFLKILKDAVDYLDLDYEYKGNGRPSIFTGDVLKAICIKAYHNYSWWRLESELRIARSMGIIDTVPKKTTLANYSQNPKVISLLHKLYKIIAEPLAEIEVYFSADATGISNAYGNTRWMKIRHTPQEAKHRKEYSKLHVVSGVKSNVICSAIITKGTAHESPYLKPLLDDSCKIFNMKEVSCDRGYLSRDNVKAVSSVGAVPYIMGKKNVNVATKGKISSWNAMLRLWKYHQQYFAEHYHKRSNVESTFGALKRKYGDFVRSKKPESQESEILAKIVCFNASVLAEALLSYDLKGSFLG